MGEGQALRGFVEARNAQLATTALLQGGMGALFSLVTFGVVWSIAWLAFGSFRAGLLAPLPLALTALFAAVATWSAWRGVDPYEHITPPTPAEAARREAEELVMQAADLGTGWEGLARREGVAGCATWLIAGPRGVLGGWRAWRRRVQASPELLGRAQELLEGSLGGPQPLEGALTEGWLLARLGLARLETDADGAVQVTPTTKGRRLLGEG